MLDEHYADAKTRMGQAVKKFAGELSKVRTGRASLAVFDGVKVDYYGSPTPINQVAALANPEPNLITIQPWEPNMLGPIEKAILGANLGLTPNNDGALIRISVPPLTEERRKEYVKQVHKLAEAAKTAVRNIRRDVNDALKGLEKEKEISQDDLHRGLDEIQKITDGKVGEIDKLTKGKESEILDV
ncbi:ribosome recycling factor [Acanthopleuribacter pedis]|uniref:Ribosome-recycling factor n=1 Tax=Acanthopleuribacter pedis TaxID=442870 RepID=A0A8J7QKQ8_9BACT|nr:ribosome recycling factor [Acanthopleuribacter pedis]MBO1320018.1 ribosome recycling factor [Acanthopleuribacter pedis]